MKLLLNIANFPIVIGVNHSVTGSQLDSKHQVWYLEIQTSVLTHRRSISISNPAVIYFASKPSYKICSC